MKDQNTNNQATNPTPDEQNDAIRAQIEREMPRPAGGFESDEQEQDHREAHEKRFFELCNLQSHDQVVPVLVAALERMTGEFLSVIQFTPGANADTFHACLTQARAALKLAAQSAPQPAPAPAPHVVIIVEYGVVQGVCANGPATATLIDYDIEGSDEDKLTPIPQPGGGTQKAIVAPLEVSHLSTHARAMIELAGNFTGANGANGGQS